MKTNKEGIESSQKRKRERKTNTLSYQNQLTCPEEEAKPTEAKNPQKMSHLNIHRSK